MGEGKKNYAPGGAKVRQPKIAVGIALTPHIFGDFFSHWNELKIDWNRYSYISVRGAYVQDAHQRIAEAFLKTDCTHLLSLEEDHIFPLDLMDRVEHWARDPKLDIVGGMYFMKRTPTFAVGFHVSEDRKTRRFTEQETVKMVAEPGLYPVGIVGLGCTLIRREVFESVEEGEPYFVTPSNWGGDEAGRIMSDDAWFCLRAGERGHSVWLDSSCQVKHLYVYPIGHEMYIAEVGQRVKERMAEAGKQDGGMLHLPPPKSVEVSKGGLALIKGGKVV